MIKNIKRIIASVIILLYIVSSYPIFDVLAAEALPATPPQNVRIGDLGYYLDSNNWSVKFNWDSPTVPGNPDTQGIDFSFDKINRGNGTRTIEDKSITMPTNTNELDTQVYGIELEKGTIYAFKGRTYYTLEDTGEFKYPSGPSAEIKFLTEIDFDADLVPGTNQIRITWDDVWDEDGRIDYRILISDTSGFTQPSPLPDIIGSEIENDDRVTVVGNKLEFIYSSALPGREYSIKILPIANADVTVLEEDELKVKKVKTEILLRTKIVGETSTGTLWKLFWDPIITGSIGSTKYEKVLYKLYRYDESENETFFAQIPDKDYFYIHVDEGKEDLYRYKVEAVAITSEGQQIPFYSNNKVGLEEHVPQYPEAPELVTAFSNAGPQPLLFDDYVTQDSAKIMWRIPVTGEGLVDEDITYDMYLVDNLDDIELLPQHRKIASSLQMNESNYIREVDTNRLIGYQYDLTNLDSNSTYYYVIKAKKNFLVENEADGIMVSKPFESMSSVQVIITLPDASSNKPIAPPAPPFQIKIEDGGLLITDTTASLQLKKEWNELYDSVDKKWMYATQEEYDTNEALADADPDKRDSRIVNYDEGLKILPYAVKFNDITATIQSLYDRDTISYSDLSANYTLAIAQEFEAVEIENMDDSISKVIDFELTDLEANTPYIVWVVIENTQEVRSDPSDPLLVTTQPEIPFAVETPTVPTDLKGLSSDKYVDLFWSIKQGYRYEIKYGTEDDIESSSNGITVSSEDFRYQTYSRVDGLEADTLYYFWIKAISTSEDGTTKESVWSNPVMITTQPYIPPETPLGFGVKNSDDAITIDSITYEWMVISGIDYILEFADNIDFNNSTEYELSGVTEHQVTSLMSNHKYYARLYAYDSTTELRSSPTMTVMIKTKRGDDEYDAGVDLDKIITGDIIEFGKSVENGVWNINIINANADRFTQLIRNDNVLDYVIDATDPPGIAKTINLEIANTVFKELNNLNENLIVRTKTAELVFRPKVLDNNTSIQIAGLYNRYNYIIGLTSPIGLEEPSGELQILQPTTKIEVKAGKDGALIDTGEFNKPLWVYMPVSDINQYMRDDIKVLKYKASNEWSELETKINYNNDRVETEIKEPSTIVPAKHINKSYHDIDTSPFASSIDNVSKLYDINAKDINDFGPEKEMTVEEGIKIILNILNVEYTGSDYLNQAVRAGIFDKKQAKTLDMLRRDMGIDMVVEAYRIKTWDVIDTKTSILDDFIDSNNILYGLEKNIAFAYKNGITYGSGKNKLLPEQTITKGEFIALIERMLACAGEL